jgi:hexulose-6-phosphate isomerase
MKKSISYWSFEGGLEGRKDVEQCFKEAKEAGFEAVELAVAETGVLILETTEEQCKEILRKAEGTGMEVSSLASGLFWDYSLTDNDSRIREKAKNIVKKMLQIASWLKLDTILVVPGAVDVFLKPDFKPVSYDVVYERALSALKELAPIAEKYRVSIGVENVWNKFLLSPLEMRDFIDKVGSGYIGVYFDVGNVLLFGFPQQWIRILGKRIKKVHFKDFKKSVGTVDGFCDLREGDVDWNEVIKAFKEVGYDDYCTAEIIPYRPNLLKKTSFAMDNILGR